MRRYQRPHLRSPRAIDKPYRFVRLPLSAEPDECIAHLHDLGSAWLPSQWKWHRGTYFRVLRGGPRGSGPASELTTGWGIDAPELAQRPGLRAWLDRAFPVAPALAWLGLSPPGAVIAAHVDNTAHWDEHHRVHVPLVTSPRALLCVEGRFVHLRPGFAWALDNSVTHGAYNGGPARVHLIVDLPDAPTVQAWLARGTHVLGHANPRLLAELERDPLTNLSDAERACPPLMERMLRQ